MTEFVSLRRCGVDDANALALVGQATFLESFAGTLDGADILALELQSRVSGEGDVAC